MGKYQDISLLFVLLAGVPEVLPAQVADVQKAEHFSS